MPTAKQPTVNTRLRTPPSLKLSAPSASPHLCVKHLLPHTAIIATPMTTNATNSPHAKTKLTIPHPPISLKSNSTCQSNTDAENAETTSPANATHVRRIVRPTQSASAMNASHAPPTKAPISTSSVRCELTSVRTVIPSGSMNALAISPDFPNPTPNGFAANSLSPASQIFGLFNIAPSSASLGHIHHAATQAKHPVNMMPQMVGTAFHRRPPQSRNGCGKAASALLATISRHNTVASIASTAIPVLEYVIASITQSATPATLPHHCNAPRAGRARTPAAPPHPQQNGNAAQIAAAAWLGFAKPNPCRTRSPTTKSTPQHAPNTNLSHNKGKASQHLQI